MKWLLNSKKKNFSSHPFPNLRGLEMDHCPWLCVGFEIYQAPLNLRLLKYVCDVFIRQGILTYSCVSLEVGLPHANVIHNTRDLLIHADIDIRLCPTTNALKYRISTISFFHNSGLVKKIAPSYGSGRGSMVLSKTKEWVRMPPSHRHWQVYIYFSEKLSPQAVSS